MNDYVLNGHIEDIYNLIIKKYHLLNVKENIFNENLKILLELSKIISHKNIEKFIEDDSNYNNQNGNIDFLPVNRLNNEKEIIAAKKKIDQVILKGDFTSGSYVLFFEKELEKFFEAKHCIATGSGTDAIIISLLASGVSVGDEVILPANSFAATENAVFAVGAIPIYADVDDDFNISASSIEKLITRKTKAVLAVCLYGRLPNFELIKSITKSYNIKLITDAAQCFGIPEVVLFSDVTAFSFNPYKNFGVFGKGGAIITNDHDTALKCREFSYHGFINGKKNFKINNFGFNTRLDNFQAGVALAKAPFFSVNALKRTYLAYKYCDLLKELVLAEKIIIPSFSAKNTWHLFPVIINNNKVFQDLIDFAKTNYQVEFERYYPVLSYKQKTEYNFINCSNVTLYNTERLHNKLIHIPLHNHMSLKELNKVVETIFNFFKEN